MNVQLDLFQDMSDIGLVQLELKAQRESMDKVRKRLFAENSGLAKEIIRLRNDMERLEQQLIRRVK